MYIRPKIVRGLVVVPWSHSFVFSSYTSKEFWLDVVIRVVLYIVYDIVYSASPILLLFPVFHWPKIQEQGRIQYIRKKRHSVLFVLNFPHLDFLVIMFSSSGGDGGLQRCGGSLCWMQCSLAPFPWCLGLLGENVVKVIPWWCSIEGQFLSQSVRKSELACQREKHG